MDARVSLVRNSRRCDMRAGERTALSTRFSAKKIARQRAYKRRHAVRQNLGVVRRERKESGGIIHVPRNAELSPA